MKLELCTKKENISLFLGAVILQKLSWCQVSEVGMLYEYFNVRKIASISRIFLYKRHVKETMKTIL